MIDDCCHYYYDHFKDDMKMDYWPQQDPLKTKSRDGRTLHFPPACSRSANGAFDLTLGHAGSPKPSNPKP